MSKLKTFVCDGCNGEYTGSEQDLKQEGWKYHKYGVRQVFLMCDECEEKYRENWESFPVSSQ